MTTNQHKVEIKKVSSGEENVSNRHITYDIYVDGKYEITVNDIVDAMDKKVEFESK